MTANFKAGRLKSLGITEKAHVALYLPKDYIDLTKPLKTFQEVYQASLEGVSIVAQGSLSGIPQIHYKPGTQPRASFSVALDGGIVSFSVFDTDEALKERIELVKTNPQMLISGIPLMFGQTMKLNNSEIQPNEFAGRVLPVYQGKPRSIKPNTAREKILEHLGESMPLALKTLQDSLNGADVSSIFDINNLEMILREAHLPTNMAYAKRAGEVLDLLAAVISKQKLATHVRDKDGWKVSARIDITRWHEVAANIEFELTGEQVEIINEIAKNVNKPVPMRGLLQGDVGSGKTAVYGVIAITAAMQGRRVAVLLPNTGLAKQVYEELKSWIPQNSNFSLNFISGESKKGYDSSFSGELFVGTSALLFRDLGEMDLICVDEQQKFSVKQRQLLMGGQSHLLEVSATPIPRSVALVKYGAMDVWRLTKNHTKKEIVSELFVGKQESKEMIRRVANTVAMGNQAIIVYALKQESESEAMEGIVSAEEAYTWWSKKYPGLVRLVHSQMSDDEKGTALQDMKDEHAKILISTTVVEVGVTIPGVHLLAVVNAERFGLVSHHQLRGRVARKGNRNGQVGEFLMLTKDNPSKDTLKRLNVMLKTNDGYEIAEYDTKLRGFGNLHIDSDTQSGADDSVFIGRKVDLELLEKVL